MKRIKELPKRAKRPVAAVAAAICLALGAQCAAEAGEVAVVDVERVINESEPGKVGQKIVDDLRAKLNEEFEAYAQSEKDERKVLQRQAELNQAYAQEHGRVAGLVHTRLREVTERWLAGNKKGFTVVVPKASTIAQSADADVSSEILRLLNRETIDYAANAPK